VSCIEGGIAAKIEAYRERTKLPSSKFGRQAFGDPRFVEDLRPWRRLSHQTRERVSCYLAQAENGVN
jgi:hypothetical protein